MNASCLRSRPRRQRPWGNNFVRDAGGVTTKLASNKCLRRDCLTLPRLSRAEPSGRRETCSFVLAMTISPGRPLARQRMDIEMNYWAAACLGSAATCSALLLASPSSAQVPRDRGEIRGTDGLAASHAKATDLWINQQHNQADGRYVSGSYPYAGICQTYPTYPMPAPPAIFSYDYGCPSRNIYHANHRASRLAIPRAPWAYDLYY